MVDVELVFELLEVDEEIKEIENPKPANITKGEIEFRNVRFTYDKKLKKEEQRIII